jgi:hypothetical protein
LREFAHREVALGLDSGQHRPGRALETLRTSGTGRALPTGHPERPGRTLRPSLARGPRRPSIPFEPSDPLDPLLTGNALKTALLHPSAGMLLIEDAGVAIEIIITLDSRKIIRTERSISKCGRRTRYLLPSIGRVLGLLRIAL